MNQIREIKDYKIKLYNCKNRHINEYINLNEYENNQNIDTINIIIIKL